MSGRTVDEAGPEPGGPGGPVPDPSHDAMAPGPPPAERRLVELMEEFGRRQRQRPELVVRPWWSGAEAGSRKRRVAGFVVEYCPGGVDSAELSVRHDRVRVEGPGGVREVPLGLADGWLLDGADRRCPETLAGHLIRIADALLTDGADPTAA